MAPDGHYRKVSVEIWSDDRFRDFTNNGKLVFLFVLTHPQMTSLGAMRASTEGLAVDLGWKHKAFREAFGEAVQVDMLRAAAVPLIVVPNFIKHNPPNSINVVKSWNAIIPTLPKCELLTQYLQQVKAYLEGMHDSFLKAYALPYDKASAMPCAIQEQEQEGEQELDREPDIKEHTSPAAPVDASNPNGSTITPAMVFEAYVKMIKPLEPPTPVDTRASECKTRLKDKHWGDTCLDAISKIPTRPFLLGSGKDGWLITFDWFLKPKSVDRINEGEFITAKKKARFGNEWD